MEKRANLLAQAFQAIIEVRQPHQSKSDRQNGTKCNNIAKSMCQNNPFRQVSSSNNILAMDMPAIHPSKFKQGGIGRENTDHLNHIKERLMEQGASQSSQSGSRGVARSKSGKKLAMPVIHESMYVYAADKSNGGGMALAEKWGLTLV